MHLNELCYQIGVANCVPETGFSVTRIVAPIRDTTMLQGKGRFLNRPTKTGKHEYDKFFVYIPTEIARDGLFPFHEGDAVTVTVDAKSKRVILAKSS